MGLGKPKLCTKFEDAIASAIAEILRGKPLISGRSPRAGPHPLFLLMMMRFGKPQLHVKFEVADFIYYGNIRESVFKLQIHFLSHPLGELGVTYKLHVQLIGKRIVDFLCATVELFCYLLQLMH